MFLFRNRQKSKISQSVLFIESKGCMAEQQYLSGCAGVVKLNSKTWLVYQ